MAKHYGSGYLQYIILRRINMQFLTANVLRHLWYRIQQSHTGIIFPQAAP